MNYGLNGYGIGLGWLGAALPISLSINSPIQVVGQTPTYRISGAPPGAQVTWTSFKDGVATGEDMAGYSGQVVESNGTVELTGGAWTADNVGQWIKQVRIAAPDGAVSQAVVMFSVVPASGQGGAPPVATGGSFLSNPLFYLGEFAITPGVLLGAAVAAWAFKSVTSKR